MNKELTNFEMKNYVVKNKKYRIFSNKIVIAKKLSTC